MTVSLQAPEGHNPLAFEQYEHLSNGNSYALLDPSGRPLQGERLDRQLFLEGVGPKTVRIEVQYADTGAGALSSTTLEATAIGTLDSQGLARLIHAEARQFTGRRKKGESPALMFIQGIEVVGPEQPKPAAPEKRTARPKVRRQYVKVPNKRTGKLMTRAVYRDKKTGRFASRAQWEQR